MIRRDKVMTDKMTWAEKALEQGKGVLRLAPVWVSRSFCRPEIGRASCRERV